MSYLGSYSTQGVTPEGERELLPDGDYAVVIVEAEVRRNKANTGDVLKLVLEIVAGEHKGRKLFDYINVKHQSEKAEFIGLKRLAALYSCLGKQDVRDTSELIGRPFRVRVSKQEGTNGYADSNTIKVYLWKESTSNWSPAASQVDDDDPMPF